MSLPKIGVGVLSGLFGLAVAIVAVVLVAIYDAASEYTVTISRKLIIAATCGGYFLAGLLFGRRCGAHLGLSAVAAIPMSLVAIGLALSGGRLDLVALASGLLSYCGPACVAHWCGSYLRGRNQPSAGEVRGV